VIVGSSPGMSRAKAPTACELVVSIYQGYVKLPVSSALRSSGNLDEGLPS
jgi:hypothetical protein